MAAVPEKSLERYELVDRIAVGGMAEVFRAKAYGAHGFEKTLAIKRILPDLARDPEFEARFIREAKLAVQLTHANIVHILDFGRFSGSLFIAMEFVDGLDLAALLKTYSRQGKRVPLAAAFQIAIDLTRGLDFAHSHAVVHRDVSPSNILLSKAGEVKIADFGIAMAAARGNRPRPSAKRRIMGKWRYMSPEQTQGDPLDHRSDLFSAAAVIYELFTGEKLFPGQEAEQIIDSVHSMEIPKISEKREGLPPRLDDVLGAALERDPEKRTNKASDMLRALTELSYESSLVATALDVAEAVAAALGKTKKPEAPPQKNPAGLGIDALIRQQLGGREPTEQEARRTDVGTDLPGIGRAPTELADDPETDDAIADDADSEARVTHTATIIKRGTDGDGVTVWDVEDGDEDTIAAVPSAIRIGKRTGSVDAIKDDPAATTKDVTGSSDPDAAAAAVEATSGRKRTAVWLVAAAAAVAATVGGAIALRGGGESGERAAVTSDAGTRTAADAPVAVRDATLSLDSEPRGATVWVDGTQLAEATPATVKVAVGGEHEVVMVLAGYRRWSDRVPVTEPGMVRVKANLVRERATLVVRSTPPGATVTLAGKKLGTTPFTGRDLSPTKDAALVISKPGFHPVKVSVTLSEARPVTVDRALRSTVRYGRINLFVRGSWAQVWFRGKKIGQGQRLEGLRLPVGKHVLKLVNPASKKQTTLSVDVVEDKVKLYKASL